MTVPDFIVEIAKLAAHGLPSAIALLAGLYFGHKLTRPQSQDDFDRQRGAANEDREALRAEFVEDRNREREMFVATGPKTGRRTWTATSATGNDKSFGRFVLRQ